MQIIIYEFKTNYHINNNGINQTNCPNSVKYPLKNIFTGEIMKQTKIIATMGPASSSPEMIEK